VGPAVAGTRPGRQGDSRGVRRRVWREGVAQDGAQSGCDCIRNASAFVCLQIETRQEFTLLLREESAGKLWPRTSLHSYGSERQRRGLVSSLFVSTSGAVSTAEPDRRPIRAPAHTEHTINFRDRCIRQITDGTAVRSGKEDSRLGRPGCPVAGGNGTPWT
jgi:hypothetical protein